MFANFQYAYLLGNLFFLLVWIILFIYRRDLRRKMLIMSLVVAPMGPLSEIFYLRDYWQPQLFNGWLIGIEDLLFGFAIGGIAAVIYEELFGKKYLSRHLSAHPKWMFGVAVFGVIWMYVGSMVLGFNSIYVSILGFLIIGASILFTRHDLLKDALFSGLLMGGLMLFFYFVFGYFFDGIIQKWWLLKNISGIIIFGAPLEELMWGFGWGFVAGPAYEFINGLRFKKS